MLSAILLFSPPQIPAGAYGMPELCAKLQKATGAGVVAGARYVRSCVRLARKRPQLGGASIWRPIAHETFARKGARFRLEF